jgi:hypothetical protein
MFEACPLCPRKRTLLQAIIGACPGVVQCDITLNRWTELMKPIIPPRLEAIIRSRLGASAPPAGTTPWQTDRCDPSEIRGGTYRPRRVRENLAYPTCVMLSDSEIVRALLRYRFDRQFRGPRRIPIKTLGDFVGLSHETLFQAMRGSVSDRTRSKLSWAVVAISEGRLHFRRQGQQWRMDLSLSHGHFLRPSSSFT